MKVIAIGDNVIDLYTDQQVMYPGGNALNVAVFCKRYGAEMSSYIGIVGNDAEGNHIERTLMKEGIDISGLIRAIGPSGKTNVVLNKEGDRVFDSWNCGGVQSQLKINITKSDLEYVQKHHILHSSVYSYLENQLPLLSKYALLSFDFSTKKERNYLEKVCPYITYGFFSGSDLNKKECIQFIQLVHSLGTKNVIITRGERSVLFSNGEKLYEQPSLKTAVIDTLGAGDSFIARFLVEYYTSKNPEHALRKAAEAASQTCTYFGAFGEGIKQ